MYQKYFGEVWYLRSVHEKDYDRMGVVRRIILERVKYYGEWVPEKCP